MQTLALDIETASPVDLLKAGVYKYAESKEFRILLLGYAFDDAPVEVVDIAQGEEIPDDVISALISTRVIKTAFNAAFERVCLTKHFDWPMMHPPEQWSCTAVLASTLGLPGSLDGVAKILRLSEQKDAAGKGLIRFFSMPSKDKGWNLPQHDLERWQQFKEYCRQDVIVERAIRKRLEQFPLPEKERRLWCLDQHINDHGVGVDRVLVENAIRCDEEFQERATEDAKKLTGLENPGSVHQLKGWLEAQGVEVPDLSKATVVELLETVEDEHVRSLLALRQQMAKTSVKKYQALDRALCEDGRVRGLLQFNGASRTGRWASRLINIQNLPQNKMPGLDAARELLRLGDLETLDMLYDSVPSILSQLIRTALVPSAGCRFIVADFASIEARILAWLAGEQWVLDVFQGHGKIYEMTASRMTGVPLEGITKDMRQKGKVATLACIAAGQLVLTDTGLVPIEDVTVAHRVWDGDSFVAHEGVVYKGRREVITYDGLTATRDHLVWVQGRKNPVPLGNAASYRVSLLQPGDAIPTVDTPYLRSQIDHVYDIVNAGPNHRFTVSGKLVHNCGYQGSTGALLAMGALKMGLKEEELPSIVKAWRSANPKIVQFWGGVEAAAIEAVKMRKTVSLAQGITFSLNKGVLFAALPSGRSLAYAIPKLENDERFNKEQITYDGGDRGRVATYGGCLVENCLAEDSLILTTRGWISIGNVTEQDRVWDGVEWCTHDGVVCNGKQQTIRLNGVGITEDHLVLTEGGWMNASSCEGAFTRSAGSYEPVYDIVNCGPKNRFTVLGECGPFIVHNCTQAVARDCLAESMLRLDEAGYKIAFHVHDEVVCEVPYGTGSVEDVCRIMSQPIDWAPGLPMAAEGFECVYYKKN